MDEKYLLNNQFLSSKIYVDTAYSERLYYCL